MAKGLSVHIGLNSVDPTHYAGWSGPLTACEADAEDMRALAAAAGIKPKLLETKQATRAAVKAAIGTASKSLKKGDFFFLTYSGHGGQVPDRDGNEDDQLDETWCLYDGELIDDELNVMLSGFTGGVRVLVLSDSCHSGTVTKVALTALALTHPRAGLPDPTKNGEPPRYRAMPMDVAQATYQRNRAFYRAIEKSLPPKDPAMAANVRLISGCQDNQLSEDGPFNGRFTGALLAVWNDGKFDGDYGKFHERIVARMPSTQTPKHFLIGPPDATYDAQRPFTL